MGGGCTQHTPGQFKWAEVVLEGMTRRWVISVESLSVPARACVLKSLKNRLDLTVADADRTGGGSSASLGLLLHRLKGLARVPASTPAMWCGSWLMKAPRDPLLRDLHRDLARALADKLVPGGAKGTAHLMLCLRAPTDEAFESLLTCELAAARDVSLQCLRDAARGMEDAPLGAECLSPFAVQIVRVDCPAFAADNPVSLNSLVDLCVTRCQGVMA